jgi:hypothetical protein
MLLFMSSLSLLLNNTVFIIWLLGLRATSHYFTQRPQFAAFPITSSHVVYVLDPKARRDSLRIEANYDVAVYYSRWGSLRAYTEHLLHRVKVLADVLLLDLDAFLGQKFSLAMAGQAARLSVYNGSVLSSLPPWPFTASGGSMDSNNVSEPDFNPLLA